MIFRLKKILLMLGVFFLFLHKVNSHNTFNKLYLEEGWRLFSSESVEVDGSVISSPVFDDEYGYSIKTPATVMHGLMQNGLFTDIFSPKVLEKMDKSAYEVPWWYRKEFSIEALSNQDFYQITFEGLNFKSNVWLNGKKIAGDDFIQGSYGVWNFEITNFLKQGNNILAVEVIPPVFGKDVHMGFVDWNPTPPDRLMGIWRGVLLSHTGPVSMRHSNVITKVDKETLKYAELTLSTVLTNHTDKLQKATLLAYFDDKIIKKEIKLKAKEEREVFLTPSDYSELIMENPKLWWPNNMGEQNLYDLKFDLKVKNKKSDEDIFRFGIREIEDFWNESGYRGFKVNGQNIMLRSAGWVDDIFLGDSDDKVKAMVRYAKHINLNSLRLEGFWGRNRTIMNMADECGLLLMYGWSAHWEWDSYVGLPHDDYVSIRGEESEILHSNNYRDQVLWLRRHPSVAIWTYGSDKLPRPSLEIKLNDIMEKIDTTRPILSYCGGSMLMGDNDPLQSEISGPTGVKMEGPYDWVPPVYWYVDKNYGGAFGFNTEVGPGPQIPPLSSIKKMIPEKDLWPINDTWLYYSGRNQFENLDRFLSAFNARYGESNNLETFIFKNQISNYEAIRPMFEAFSANKFHSTGVVQWMFNSAWPTLYWQLFDYSLMPNGAFYGTKKAASPILPIYNYGDNGIYINNDKLEELLELTLEVKIYDINSNLLFNQAKCFNIGPNKAEKVFDMPELIDISSTYFLDLRLIDYQGNMIENNFYWLSTKPDIPDFEKTTWYWTPNKQHADFSALKSMPETEITYTYSIQHIDNSVVFNVEVYNPTDKIAFFIDFMLIDNLTDEPVLPVFWNDNYITLLPGEKRIIEGTAEIKYLKNVDNLIIDMQGFNVNAARKSKY